MKSYTMTDLKAAEAFFTAARRDFNAIKEQIDERELAPKRRALVGKCFRYRNNYSCPVKPTDYWWLWTRITGLDGASLMCLQVQCDKYGKIIIETCSIPSFNGTMREAGYQPVTRQQFKRACAGLLATARKMIGGAA